MGQLKKIIRVENTGRLKNCISSGDTQLLDSSVIYGTNGDGKSTLCAILRSLSENDPSYVMGRKTLGQDNDPRIQLLCDGYNADFKDGEWQGDGLKVAVYDDTFIEQNIFSGNSVDADHRRSLYQVIIGKKGVQIAQAEADLTQKVKELTAKLKEKEKLIQAKLPDGVKSDIFYKLEKSDTIEQEIEDQQKILEGVKQAAVLSAQAGFETISLPELPGEFVEVLSTTLENVEREADSRISDHVAKHKMGDDGKDWLESGIDFIADENCPFCAQNIAGNAQVAAYKAVFSDTYRGLKSKIATMRKTIQEQFGGASVAGIEVACQKNATALEFWKQFIRLDAESLAPPEVLVEALSKVRKAALAALDAKLAAPLEEIEIGKDLADAIDILNGDLVKAAAKYEEAIRNANTLVTEAKAEAGNSDVLTTAQKLNLLLAQKLRFEAAMVADCAERDRLTTELATQTVNKQVKRQELDEYTAEVMPGFENRINQLLRDFNATFRLVQTTHSFAGGQVSTTYRIQINGEAIALGDATSPNHKPSFKNTLSAGDKSTLALAFFLTAQDHDPDKSETVVVFDDPFTSQDRFRKSNTIFEIRRVGREAAQVIVLSHDEGFLKDFWEKSDPGTCKSLKLHSQGQGAGSILMECDIKELCQARMETERQHLLAFLREAVGNPHDIIKKMRVVLENHLGATFPATFENAQWLGDMCRAMRDQGQTGLAWHHYDHISRINDYTSGFHHGDDPTQIDTSKPIDNTELRGFVEWTLTILNAL